jgi:hypothetical protein
MSADTPTPAPFADEASHSDQDGIPRGRQCSRCQKTFEAEPTHNVRGPRGWWLCPPCQITLIGEPRHQPATAMNHPSFGP